MRFDLMRVGTRVLVLSSALTTVSFLACKSSPESRAERQSETPIVGDALLLASVKVALPPPGVTPGDLPSAESDGAAALLRFCAPCHDLPSPRSHSATDWPAIVRRMWLRAERVDPQFLVPIPTVAERFMLLRYMLDNALQVSAAELPSGPGRDLFIETCTRCHELPDIRQHSAGDWAAVVMRMREHMDVMLGETPSQWEIQNIVIYLEQATQ